MVAGLADWRDAALIVLAVETLLGVAAVGLVLYASLRGLAQLREQLRPWLFEARLVTWRVCDRINQVMRAVAMPFVRLHSALAGLKRALQVLFPPSSRTAAGR